jgi:hypothetical protein
VNFSSFTGAKVLNLNALDDSVGQCGLGANHGKPEISAAPGEEFPYSNTRGKP